LAVAANFEFYSWRISYSALFKQKDTDESVWDEIIGSKDRTVFAISSKIKRLWSGSPSHLLGFSLIRFHTHCFDPVACMVIGLLLTFVAILLGRESGALLVGERANRTIVKRIRKSCPLTNQ